MTDDDVILGLIAELSSKVSTAAETRWGTVAQSQPLMVILDADLDADDNPVQTPARSAVGALEVGVRVFCVEQNFRLTVVGDPRRKDRGRVSITPVANTPTFADITFVAGVFATAPHVLLTPVTSVPGTQVLGVGVSDVTADGARIWLTRSDTSVTSVNWLAIA